MTNGNVVNFPGRAPREASGFVWLKGYNGLSPICVNPAFVTHLSETSHGRQTRIHFAGQESIVADALIGDVAARLGHC
jgi:hypothetical protein